MKNGINLSLTGGSFCKEIMTEKYLRQKAGINIDALLVLKSKLVGMS